MAGTRESKENAEPGRRSVMALQGRVSAALASAGVRGWSVLALVSDAPGTVSDFVYGVDEGVNGDCRLKKWGFG